MCVSLRRRYGLQFRTLTHFKNASFLDVNECLLIDGRGVGLCGNGSSCQNLPGSCRCICPEGSAPPEAEPCSRCEGMHLMQISTYTLVIANLTDRCIMLNILNTYCIVNVVLQTVQKYKFYLTMCRYSLFEGCYGGKHRYKSMRHDVITNSIKT